jgi:L-2-hydroxyglutarate oxidase LhgO
VDVVVVGAGVVGLACAAALARAGRSVVVIERHAGVAREASSRNSEVIHAGIHYPPGSLKAALCTEGREALYARCRTLRIPHRRIGKLVVATGPGELETLERIREQGRANGVPGLEILEGAAVRAVEPELRVQAALLSPATGIVDAMALCLSYQAESEAHGAQLVLRTEVEGIEARRGGYRVEARGADGEATSVGCAALVNAAGLGSEALAERAGIDVDARGYRLHPCKGDYFALAASAPLRVSRPVYPVPGAAGLGIHATPDLGGRIRFGPDAEYVAQPRYDVDPGKAEHFARAVRRYLPAMEEGWLTPEGAGVRARLAAPGERFRDFVVSEESEAGLPGLVSCIGIESPGLTSAPAIARRVVERLGSL